MLLLMDWPSSSMRMRCTSTCAACCRTSARRVIFQRHLINQRGAVAGPRVLHRRPPIAPGEAPSVGRFRGTQHQNRVAGVRSCARRRGESARLPRADAALPDRSVSRARKVSSSLRATVFIGTPSYSGERVPATHPMAMVACRGRPRASADARGASNVLRRDACRAAIIQARLREIDFGNSSAAIRFANFIHLSSALAFVGAADCQALGLAQVVPVRSALFDSASARP